MHGRLGAFVLLVAILPGCIEMAELTSVETQVLSVTTKSFGGGGSSSCTPIRECLRPSVGSRLDCATEKDDLVCVVTATVRITAEASLSDLAVRGTLEAPDGDRPYGFRVSAGSSETYRDEWQQTVRFSEPGNASFSWQFEVQGSPNRAVLNSTLKAESSGELAFIVGYVPVVVLKGSMGHSGG